jgi:hypothetical protein
LTDEKWSSFVVPELPSIATRSSAAPASESIVCVLPNYSGRSPGSRVYKVPGVPLVKTALQYLMLFFTSTIVQIFIAATNSFGRYNNAKWEDTDETEFKTFLGLILHFGVVKYPRRKMAWMKDENYSLP